MQGNDCKIGSFWQHIGSDLTFSRHFDATTLRMENSEIPKAATAISGSKPVEDPELQNEIAKETFWRWIIAGSFITLGVILAACVVGAFCFDDVGQRQWFQNTGTTIVGALIGFISGFYSKSKGGK